MNIDPSRIKYAHFIDREVPHTIGYYIDDDTNTVSFAVAYTNPNDQYNKAIGRSIVTGRLLKGGLNSRGQARRYTVPFSSFRSTKYRDIVSAIESMVL